MLLNFFALVSICIYGLIVNANDGVGFQLGFYLDNPFQQMVYCGNLSSWSIQAVKVAESSWSGRYILANFDEESGPASPAWNVLHYWLVYSQRNPCIIEVTLVLADFHN